MSSNSSASSSPSSASSSNASSNSLSYSSTSSSSSSSSNTYQDVSAMQSLDQFGKKVSWSNPDAALAIGTLANINIYIAVRKLGTRTGGNQNPYTVMIAGAAGVPFLSAEGITSDIQAHSFLLFQVADGPYKDFGIAVELLADLEGKVRFFFTDMYEKLNVPDENKYFVCSSQTRLRFLVNFCIPPNDAVGVAQKAWFGQNYIAIGKNCKAWAHLIAQSIKGEGIAVKADFVDSWGTSEKFVQYWENDNDCKTFFKSGQDFSAGRAGKNAQKIYDQK